METITELTHENEILKQATELDYSLQLDTDIFNANTVSIQELKKAIDDDANIESVEDKRFKLAAVLVERVSHYKELITGKKQEILEASSLQRSTQQYLNELANKLRQEERDKLKLADLNYEPKPIKKPSKISTKKYDKSGIREWSAKSGIPEFLLQTTCVSRNCSPQDAVHILRESGY